MDRSITIWSQVGTTTRQWPEFWIRKSDLPFYPSILFLFLQGFYKHRQLTRTVRLSLQNSPGLYWWNVNHFFLVLINVIYSISRIMNITAMISLFWWLLVQTKLHQIPYKVLIHVCFLNLYFTFLLMDDVCIYILYHKSITSGPAMGFWKSCVNFKHGTFYNYWKIIFLTFFSTK